MKTKHFSELRELLQNISQECQEIGDKSNDPSIYASYYCSSRVIACLSAMVKCQQIALIDNDLRICELERLILEVSAK